MSALTVRASRSLVSDDHQDEDRSDDGEFDRRDAPPVAAQASEQPGARRRAGHQFHGSFWKAVEAISQLSDPPRASPCDRKGVNRVWRYHARASIRLPAWPF